MEENKRNDRTNHTQSCAENGEDEKSCSCTRNLEPDNSDNSEDSPISVTHIIAAAVLFFTALAFSYFSLPRRILSSFPDAVAEKIDIFIRIVLYFAAYLLCGLSVVKKAVWNLFHGKIFDEQFLMALASLVAIGMGEYPEAVAVMLFYQIGEYFQDYAVNKSRNSVGYLMKLRPDKAYILKDGKTIQVKPEEVSVGETILVKSGDRIPLDGIVAKGSSFVDTSAQTGESVPREVFEGTDVLAGFVNIQGLLEITVTKRASESSAARILELVEHASKNKAKSERFITKFARIYTPAVCLVAVLLALIPPLVTGSDWNQWIYRSLVFLVVSCPCALVVSVPLSFFGGIGAASRKGILVKGGNYLETLAHAHTVVFDKTGTLTKGTFTVTAIHPANASKISADDLIAIATHAEFYSNHPISKSLKKTHHGECCEKIKIDKVEEFSGLGICVQLNGQSVLAGNLKMMKAYRVKNYMPCAEKDVGTIVHVAVDGEYAGHIVISDELKSDSVTAVKCLKKLGVRRTVMLTGDTSEVANRTAELLGIDVAYADLLPGDKVEQLEKIIQEKTNPKQAVLYVGDGINDAPVLARADVGIAMGALGSDAAMEAADVVIMTDEPSLLVDGIALARQTLKIVYENITLALTVKFLILILGAFGWVGMWAAVFGDVGVLFLAILNALRLLAIRK